MPSLQHNSQILFFKIKNKKTFTYTVLRNFHGRLGQAAAQKFKLSQTMRDNFDNNQLCSLVNPPPTAVLY